MPTRYTSYSQNKNTYTSFKASQSDQSSPVVWVVRQVAAFGKWGGSKAKQLYWPGSLQWTLQPRQRICNDCMQVCKSHRSEVANLPTLHEFRSFRSVKFEVLLSPVIIVHVLGQAPNVALHGVANDPSVHRWKRLPLSNHWESGSNKQLAI